MILLEADWDKIKTGWSKNDQLTLIHSRCGQSIVPRAYLVNDGLLPPDMRSRLRAEIAQIGGTLDGTVVTGSTEAEKL